MALTQRPVLCEPHHLRERGTSVIMGGRVGMENRCVPPTEKAHGCFLSLSEGTGLGWLDWGKNWIAELTLTTPQLNLIGNGSSSLRVGLCCPPLRCPPLFAGNAEPCGWSSVWSLALGLEAQPCHLCVSQDLQTDLSLVRHCGAALASESPWDRKEKTPMPDPT